MHCTGEKAVQCFANFDNAIGGINDAVESTMQNGWMNYTFDEAGEVQLEPTERFSEDALVGNQLVRSMIIYTLHNRQLQLGCDLSRSEVEQKVIEQMN